MNLKKLITTNLSGLKKQKPKNLIDFIKHALQDNGGDYETIRQRMTAVVEFVTNAKKYGANNVERNFYKIKEAYEDFFVGDKKISKTKFHPDEYKAMYQRKSENENKIWEKRGVAVFHDPNKKTPLMYFGKRKSWAEFHKHDTGILFTDDALFFHDEYTAHYDEICLWGSGAEAKFIFDDLNRLRQVEYRVMCEPRLGIWGDTEVIDLTSAEQTTTQQLKLPITRHSKFHKLCEMIKLVAKPKPEPKQNEQENEISLTK